MLVNYKGPLEHAGVLADTTDPEQLRLAGVGGVWLTIPHSCLTGVTRAGWRGKKLVLRDGSVNHSFDGNDEVVGLIEAWANRVLQTRTISWQSPRKVRIAVS